MLTTMWSTANGSEILFLIAAIVATLAVIVTLIRDVVTVSGVATVLTLALISWGLFAL